MPEWIFFICIMETIIGVYIIRKAFKKRKELEKTVAELLENVRRRNQEIQKEQRRNAELMLSLENAENVHAFVNKMGFKQTYRHQRYLKIYQKKLTYIWWFADFFTGKWAEIRTDFRYVSAMALFAVKGTVTRILLIFGALKFSAH